MLENPLRPPEHDDCTDQREIKLGVEALTICAVNSELASRP